MYIYIFCFMLINRVQVTTPIIVGLKIGQAIFVSDVIPRLQWKAKSCLTRFIPGPNHCGSYKKKINRLWQLNCENKMAELLKVYF